jgi:hypothetical protein
MPYYFTFSAQPTGVRLPYHQATATQRALAVDHLQQRLGSHFPTLRASTWSQALAEYQPDLWLTGQAVALAETALTQLAQHLAAAPEFPVLDPPLYGLPALHLAQHSLQTSELATWAIGEIAASATACGPRLYALLCRLAWPILVCSPSKWCRLGAGTWPAPRRCRRLSRAEAPRRIAPKSSNYFAASRLPETHAPAKPHGLSRALH